MFIESKTLGKKSFQANDMLQNKSNENHFLIIYSFKKWK